VTGQKPEVGVRHTSCSGQPRAHRRESGGGKICVLETAPGGEVHNRVPESRECAYWLKLIAADQPQLDEGIRLLLDDCGQLAAVLTSSIKKLGASST
jgi:hypothetical protein